MKLINSKLMEKLRMKINTDTIFSVKKKNMKYTHITRKQKEEIFVIK